MQPTSLYSTLLAPWLQCACLFSILLFPTRILAQVSTRNTTIPLDSPQIIYTPFLCGRDNTPKHCNDGWVRQQTTRLKPTVSTRGPDQQSNNIIPQMFFEFRGSALYLFALPASNAQANITVTTNETTISATFDSTLGQASILNLDSSSITKFALTYLPTNIPREFSLASMVITIPKGTLMTTLPLLPSMTLPPSSSAPIFTPSPTLSTSTVISTASPGTVSDPQSISSSKRSNIAIAVGVTLGLGLGLTTLAGAGFWWYSKRHPKRKWIKSLTVDQTGVTREVGGLVADNFNGTGRIGDPIIGVAFRFGEGRPRSVSPAWRDSSIR